jgi:hypothetical protein
MQQGWQIMCCPLDQLSGKLIIQAVAFEKKNDDHDDIMHLKGFYDRTPNSLTERILRYFQRIELLEKIMEIGDESFHLLNTVFQRYTNLMVYQTLRNLHHGAHDIEHVLHSFCFLGDVARLFSGKFFQDQQGKRLDYLRCLSRICHAVAHCFATAQFLSELKLLPLNQFEKTLKSANLLSALGYAMWTASLVWERYQGKANEQFAEDMGIHLGGCVFEAVHVIEEIEGLSPSLDYTLSKVGSLAGIIHAWCVVHRLMPQDQEEIEVEFTLPEEQDHPEEDSSPHCHHHHHHHMHEHNVRYYQVKGKTE